MLTQLASDSTNASANASTASTKAIVSKFESNCNLGNCTWAGGVLAPATGKIYGIPADANAVLVIDPAKGTVDTTSMQVPSSSSIMWASGVLAPATGNIYGIPCTADAVLVIDPVKGTADATSMKVPSSTIGVHRWSGGVLVPATGKIYGE